MRAVVQRVKKGSVTVEGQVVGAIAQGLVVLLGVGQGDGTVDAQYLAEKIVNLRIFEDAEGKLNLSLLDTGREVLAISQFTLYGDCRKGRRPGFSEAATPQEANLLYKHFAECLRSHKIKVATGKFQSHMVVEILNDGPVTMLLDSKKNF